MSHWFSARAAAYWLIALIVFPFSAPLSVCDLSELASNTSAAAAPFSNMRVRASVVKHALAQVFPVRSNRNRRDAESLGGTSLLATVHQPARASRSQSAASSPPRPASKTVLRI